MYEIIIGKRADKQLRKLDKRTYQKVMEAIYGLAHDPRPPGCKKMVGDEKGWRIRVGDHRVVYDVNDKQLRVLIFKFGHRKKIYRRP